MADVIIIGDGPGGLSAAVMLAKNEMSVIVIGQDKTAMNFALLRNYLGIPEIHGKDFQRIAREQAESFGAKISNARVEEVDAEGDGYKVTLESGSHEYSRYLVLSEGKGPRLAKSLGLRHSEDTGIACDGNGLTKLERVYVVGRSRRPGRSQAIISAGDGAAAAIDILSREKGESFCDWDSPES